MKNATSIKPTEKELEILQILWSKGAVAVKEVHEALGGTGEFAPMPHISEVDDLDIAGRTYPIIEGDYSAQHGTWGRRPIAVGAVVPPPVPVFTKLDDEIIDAELERMAAE